MRRQNLSAFIEGALMIGIATILSFFKVFQAPYGGSVTLGSMVPIILYSVRHGASRGFFAGTVYGLLQLMIEPFIVHPVQVILDYPLAFGMLGFAGLFGRRIYLGIPVGILGRFLSHLLSGVIFFYSYAPEGMSPLVYSVLYNGGYLLPELVISLLVLRFVLYRFIRKDEGCGVSD